MDYSRATLLGNGVKAHKYRIEAIIVSNAVDDGSEDDPSSLRDWFGVSSSRDAKSAAFFLTTMLRTMASIVAIEGTYLTDSLDPEGYLRQQLRMVSDHFDVMATSVFEISQALTY